VNPITQIPVARKLLPLEDVGGEQAKKSGRRWCGL
jgi:hypothetical protein